VKEPVHPPKQQRSRDTLARLMEATIETLEVHGLAGATIPRIAAAAKVAPASVYRRFRDKESLFRTAFLDALEKSNAINAAAVPALIKGRTLDWVGGALARSLIAQYRARPGLLRAMIRFWEADDDEVFRERAMALVAGNAATVVDAIVEEFRDEIAHDDPHRAVTFVTLVMANVVETRALEKLSLWDAMLTLSDEETIAQLKQLFLTYLRHSS
jgi:AcrR family transcriptional regulator